VGKNYAGVSLSEKGFAITSCLWTLISRLTFSRIKVIKKSNLPRNGSVLFVGTHRNGALDSAPYKKAVPYAVPMVSAQLHRSFIGRTLFRGVPVARIKDRRRGIQIDNRQSMELCAELLCQKRDLIIFPEGTSTLGPIHRPYHRGAAQIASSAIEKGADLTIVPLAVYYEDPTRWMTPAEVLEGTPFKPADADEKNIHTQITRSLEDLGAYFPDEEQMKLCEQIAYLVSSNNNLPYSMALNNLQSNLHPDAAATMREINLLADQLKMRRYRNLPVMPQRLLLIHFITWFSSLMIIFPFTLIHLPVLSAGFYASRKLPDEENVVSFWRSFVGIPVAVGWVTTLHILSIFWSPLLIFLYWPLTILGITLWDNFRRSTTGLYNGIFFYRKKLILLELFQRIINITQNESPV